MPRFTIPSRIFQCFLLLIVSACPRAVRAQVNVWEATLTLPTYEEGLPDVNPPFDAWATDQFNYPYTLRNNLTGQRTDHAWRAIYMENEYLKCSVLPDIGGHVYTCVDKISGQSMFYANPSIKKALIGYRGAWAAFGIEFNFPISHNWVSMSPVNFSYAKHEDGSASVTVGNIDRAYGMEWGVELVLRPGSTVLEQRVNLYNRSDVRHRFYWWNNAGIQVWDDSHIEYPMRFAASHGFRQVQPWPVDPHGVDLSIIGNGKSGPVAMFVHGSREPFMAAWNPKTNTGTAHFADYSDLPAKKIWSWGVDPDGLDWRKALSDNNSAYIELQAGLFRNQETYAFLEPGQTIHFSEYWMPVRNTGGIARANLTGVVNLSRQENKLVAALNVNQKIPGASVQILDQDKVILTDKADLSPEHTWTREFAIPDASHNYTFQLHDSKGGVLLEQTEGKYDWAPESEIHVGPQPSYHMPSAESRREDDWLQLGNDEELNGKLLIALETYKSGLSKFPQSFVLNKAAGRLATCLFHWNDAVRYLEPVQARNTTDSEISYYLGLAYQGMHRDDDARTALEAAYRMPTFHTAATLELAELASREGNLSRAEEFLESGLNGDPNNIRMAEDLVVVLGALGKDQQARTLAQKWHTRFPLSEFLDLQIAAAAPLSADSEHVLNMAVAYMRLGLNAQALDVLSRKYAVLPADQVEPGSLLPQDHPMVAYYRAYLREKLGQSTASDYAAASKLSTLYVFPNRSQDLDVLQAALRANSADATAHYLLGTLYFSRGLTDPALEEWSAAKKYNPNIPDLAASSGLALLRMKKDTQGALAAFRQGVGSDPMNPALYIGMDNALGIMGAPASERVSALEQYPDMAKMPNSLVYELALNLSEAGDMDRAEALFRNRFFAQDEGGTNVQEVWLEVRLQKALALGRSGDCKAAIHAAENFGNEPSQFLLGHSGPGSTVDSARVNYLLGSLFSKCGDQTKARARFETAAKSASPAEVVWAWKAAKRLDGFDQTKWQQRLETALVFAKNMSENNADDSWSAYNTGLIQKALGHENEAIESFHTSLLLPDRMLAHHLARLASEKTATPN